MNPQCCARDRAGEQSSCLLGLQMGTVMPNSAHGVCHVPTGSSTRLAPCDSFSVPAVALPHTAGAGRGGGAAAGTRHDTVLPDHPQLVCSPLSLYCPNLWTLLCHAGGLVKPGLLVSLSCSPCAGPHILGSPEGAAGLCLPSSAWLNLNRAGLLHQSLSARDKDGQARPGPGGVCCPEPGCLPPGQDPAPAEHPA